MQNADFEMKDSILNAHIFMCIRKKVNWFETPMKIVGEMFYNNNNKFNQSLYDKVVNLAILDETQSCEERGAFGQKFLISTNLFKNL